MVTKWLSLCLIVVALSSGLNVALAQQSDDPLNGYWKQVGESVYIQITRSGEATVRINRSGELSTRLKPGGRATWERRQPVKKAY
jgi:hypothetical protein